jgi:hypothetical protein
MPSAPASAPPSTGQAQLDRPKSGLSARSQRIAWAVTEALLCDEDERGALVPASPAACARAVAGLDDSLGRSSGDLRRGFAVLAILIEFLPLFVIGAPRRMSRLPLDRRLAYLEALEMSRVGLLCMLLVAFKIPLCVPAFEEGEELLSTGFDREHLSARRRLPLAAAGRTEAA